MALSDGTSRAEWGNGEEYIPALLLVELIAHIFGEFLELPLGLGIVGVDHEVLEVPETPREVLETLALLEVGRYLGAYL